MVRQSEYSRFVLTTREHILRNALQLSEKLAQSPVLEHRCILELRDYTVGQRARIQADRTPLELSAAHPSSALPEFLHSNAHLVLPTLARLLNAPEIIRWEKQRDGSTRGYVIDMCSELRIVFVLTVAEAWHSISFLDFAAQAADGLVQNWTRSRVDFLPTLRLLAAFKDKGWVQQNGGIRIYRAVLSGLLKNLEFAHGTEWGKILAFSETALEWTEADDARLTAAFTQYQISGVDDDIWNCTSADEAGELKDALEEMQTKFGVDFVQKVGRLDEELYDEHGEPSDDLRRAAGIRAPSVRPSESMSATTISGRCSGR
jgi:hypothetical protein